MAKKAGADWGVFVLGASALFLFLRLSKETEKDKQNRAIREELRAGITPPSLGGRWVHDPVGNPAWERRTLRGRHGTYDAIRRPGREWEVLAQLTAETDRRLEKAEIYGVGRGKTLATAKRAAARNLARQIVPDAFGEGQ